MVATRRNAPKEPELDMADPELALRKKPVRKATGRTKKTNAAPPPEPLKPRATRGRKAVVDAAPEESLVEETPAPEPEPPVRAKPARRVGRPRKQEQAPPVPDEPAPETANNGTRATRTTVSRSRKTEVCKDEVRKEAAAEEKPKPVVRKTRATAASSKAQPLSPKKITQVSKPQTRNDKAAIAKTKTAKTAPAARTTRKRAVSDENEEIPTLAATNDKEDGLGMTASTPVKCASPAKPASLKKSTEVTEEDVMSSRPTTPSDSPAPSFDGLQDESEYHKPGKLASASGESEDENDAESDGASEDELCGPKTPMKRTSPGAEARYLQSVQRTIRRAEIQEATGTPLSEVPIRRKATTTPKTQQLHSKRTAPASEVRAMTVARGAARAMVFKQLQPLSPAVEHGGPADDGQDDEPVGVQDTSILSVNEAPVPSLTLPSSPISSTAEAPDLHMSEDTFNDESTILDDESSSTAEAPDLHMPEDTFNDESTILDEVVAHAQLEDPDETVLVDEGEEHAEPPVAPAEQESDDAEDTAPIDQAVDESLLQASMTIEDEAEGEPTTQVMSSRTPETIPWDNLRQDVTIPFNFDAHFENVTLVPEARHVDLEADIVSIHSGEPEERQVSEGTDIAHDLENMASMNIEEPITPAAPDATVNLNEFIDLAALAEPTQPIELPSLVNDADNSDVLPSSEIQDFDGKGQQPDSPAADDLNLKAGENVGAGLPVPGQQPEAAGEVDTSGEGDADTMSVEDVSLMQSPSAAAGADQDENAIVDDEDVSVPHYALPTFAFDARRKSLPAFSSIRTPVKGGTRPITSDGASMPRVVDPFINIRWTRSRGNSTAATPYATPSRQAAASPVVAKSAARTPQATPAERYPALGARQTYEEHAKTAIAPKRFMTPTQTSTKRANSARKPSASADTLRASTLRPRQVAKPSTPTVLTMTEGSNDASSPIATPSERFPRLGARTTYEDHAKTVAGPARFHTPKSSPAKRPDTIQKHGSLRKVAFKNSTPRTSSHTPMKTPLKPAAMTPGLPPMTPHPSAPLRGVVAMVEVYTNEGASASAPFIAQLQRLGAKTTKVWSERVTHVVFKDGSPTTLQRVRLHNKEVEELGNAPLIYCVNSRWVSACDDEGRRIPESSEDFAVDLDEVPRGGRRRRKSMEPSSLVNVDGSILRNCKSSLGRSSLGRSPLKFDSPAKRGEIEVVTPKVAGFGGDEGEDKENSDMSSPVTPAYLAAPDQLVQQTAPVNKMRKLGMKAADRAKNRRLTYFPSMA